MEKPFDVKDLVAKLKAKGLPVAEDVAQAAVGEFFAWAEESVKLTKNVFDDMFLPQLAAAKAAANATLDKIDGVVGQ